MRRPLLVLLVVLLVVLAAGAAAGLAGGKAAAPAASPAAAQPVQHWCNFVLAGKNATTDGSVLMGYNNDWAPNNYTYLQVVPGDATHYQYVRVLTLGSVPEGGINVKQLGVNFGTATTLDSAVLAADPFVKKGYGGEIWDTILQKCATAQQALALLSQMSQTGFTAGAAGSFGIADPNEAWTFELLGGHHWVAQRVPDNAVLAHPNIVVVRQINLSDTANFRGSSDLQSFAQSIGRYSPSEGPFDVAWAYHDRDVLQSYYNTDRLWGAFDLVAPSLNLTPDHAVRHASRVRRAGPQGQPAGHRGHLPLPLRRDQHRPDRGLLADEPAQSDQPADLLLDDVPQRGLAAAVLEARRHRRRDVGGPEPAVLQHLRAVLRLRLQRAGRVGRQDRVQRVPRRGREPGQERHHQRAHPLRVLHPAGEEHVRRVRDRLHQRAGEHGGDGRRPYRAPRASRT